ncbi:MAG: dihydroorotate dehydrogenase [candidate division WOR-3 bacterium]
MKGEVVVGGVRFANPVLAASGTFGYGVEFKGIANRLGGIVTKGVTLEERAGNPPPRIAEFPSGIVNSVGLENPGLIKFKRQILPKLEKIKTRILVNVAGFEVDEFIRLAEGLEEENIDGLELNLSCPNVSEGGVVFGQSPQKVEEITRAVRKRTKKLLVVKLTANFVDPRETAKAAEAAGADAVTVINTLYGLILDDNGRPFLGGRTGGISGPAIKPFALFCVDRVAGAVKIPVIGCGGIISGRDAFDFLCAGARLVQVGSANLTAPNGALRVLQELKIIISEKRIKGWESIVGTARRG